MAEKKPVKKATKVVDKNIVDESMDKVMEFATKGNAEGMWTKFLNSFQDREVQDYIFFVLGIILLILSLRELWKFARGIILLLGSVLLFNLFFSKK
jgi:uncharacterized membrane protein